MDSVSSLSQIKEFRPTNEMRERLQTLLNRSKEGDLTLNEEQELREYERIEHIIELLRNSFFAKLSLFVTRVSDTQIFNSQQV